MEVVRKKMLIKYWDDMYSIGHMALFQDSKRQLAIQGSRRMDKNEVTGIQRGEEELQQ